jgi:hypothetical protein
MQSSPASCHFFPLRSEYSPQESVLKTLNLCSSHNVRDQVSHPYKTTGKTLFIYFNFYVFLFERRREVNRLWRE